jgi:epoxyqueuosine reductase
MPDLLVWPREGPEKAREAGTTTMAKDLKAWAERRNWAVEWGPASLADEVRSELAERRRTGEVAPSFAERWLKRFDAPPDEGGTAIVVAVPRPAHRIRFATPAGEIAAVVPPTYIGDSEVAAAVRRELASFLELGTDEARPLQAPLKAVAVRLGLARYGRNNIAYVPGMGSYVELVGAHLDSTLDVPRGWRLHPYALMPECETCDACRSACPAGAMGEDRVLLHAERCLTNYNELPGDWPDWLDPAWHNCLLGCLYCQNACPQNVGRLTMEEADVSFDLEETAALAADAPVQTGPVGDRVTERVARLGLTDYDAVLGRNLRALLAGGA